MDMESLVKFELTRLGGTDRSTRAQVSSAAGLVRFPDERDLILFRWASRQRGKVGDHHDLVVSGLERAYPRKSPLLRPRCGYRMRAMMASANWLHLTSRAPSISRAKS
jgi:hypothetical protein